MRMRRKAFAGGLLPQGQIVFEYISASAQTWTVPSGVTAISMVCVGAHNGGTTSITVNSVVVCRASEFAVLGDGGGLGGAGGGAAGTADPVRDGGGGGAGGYSGEGGYGVSTNSASGAGAGGGGSGGSPKYLSGTGYLRAGGGGVGLLGEGPSGAAVTANGGKGGSGGTDGVDHNSGGYGGKYGGGYGGIGAGGQGTKGGSLAWKNNVSVTPGQVVSVAVSGPNGGARIMWGGSRSYPYNAGDVNAV